MYPNKAFPNYIIKRVESSCAGLIFIFDHRLLNPSQEKKTLGLSDEFHHVYYHLVIEMSGNISK